MPIKQNAKKADRQRKKRAARNLVVKNAYKDAVKAVSRAVDAGQDVKEALRMAQQKLDKAAKRGVIKKNTAGRKLSRLMKRSRVTVKQEVKQPA